MRESQATSTLAQTQALIPQFQLQLRVASDQLCVLLGMPPSSTQIAGVLRERSAMRWVA